MDWEITITLIIVCLIVLGSSYLLKKYINKKYKTLVGLTISVLGLLLAIISRFYYNDHIFFNTPFIFLCTFPIVIYIGSMLYKRFKQKQ